MELPASGFFRSFLEFQNLQPHHLTPNAVVLLSAFATLCEGFLGVLPTLKLWGEFFSSNLGTHVAGIPAQCGTYVAVRCSTADNPFPPISLIKSVKMWQRSYFYVKNLSIDGDWVNLPPYSAAPGGPRAACRGPSPVLGPSGMRIVVWRMNDAARQALTGGAMLMLAGHGSGSVHDRPAARPY